MMLSLSISLDSARAKRAGGIPDLSVSFAATAVGEITTDKATGNLTVTVTEPAAYAGTYTQDTDSNALNQARLAGGPQALVAPAWQGDGSPAIGEAQPFLRGLWVFDEKLGAPTISHDVVRDGAAVLVDDAGYTGSDSYTPVASDGGAGLTVVETAAQGGNSRSTTSAALAIPAASAGISLLETAEGRIEADNVTGDLTVTIDSPAAYAGTYTHDTDGHALNAARLAGGPQALVAPTWQDDGSPAIGEAQSFLRGLWVYDTAQGEPVIKHDVLSGATVRVDDAGYTGSDSYTPVPGDGGSLTVVETAAQGGRSRTAASAALAIPSAVVDATWLGHHEINGQAQTTRTQSDISLGEEVADREILVVLAGRMSAIPVLGDWTARVGSTALTPVGVHGSSSQALHLVWRGTVPSGASADVTVARASGTTSCSGGVFAIVRLTGSPVLDAPVTATDMKLPGDGSKVFDLSLDVADGDALIVSASSTNKLAASGFVFTGATERVDGGHTNGGGAVAFEAGLPAGTPRTVTVRVTGELANADASAAAWRIRA